MVLVILILKNLRSKKYIEIDPRDKRTYAGEKKKP